MSRFLVALLAGLLGGGAGALAVHQWRSSPSEKAVDASAEGRAIDELKVQVAELKNRLDHPAPEALGPMAGPSPLSAAGSGSSAGKTATGEGSTPQMIPVTELQAAVEKALAAEFEKRDAADKAAKSTPKKKVTLAEAAREVGLSAAQESDLRRAYEESTQKYLKLFAEPESDPESLRRELEAAKDDPAKKAALAGRMVPKLLNKLGDVMAIEAERQQKVAAAVPAEQRKQLEKYTLVEEDPFDFGGSFVVGTQTGGD